MHPGLCILGQALLPLEYEARARGDVDLDLVPVVFAVIEGKALVYRIALNQVVTAEGGVVSVENQTVASRRDVDAIVRV